MRLKRIYAGCFADTSDKIVLHPGHLGYNFDYPWGRCESTDDPCWDQGTAPETIREANNKLYRIGEELEARGYTVWTVLPEGNAKGYLNTEVTCYLHRYDETVQDVVLFDFDPKSVVT